jgi:DNA-binding transcriptional LysR family regulator
MFNRSSKVNTSRTTRGAVLTEAGATFREHAARIAAELDSAQEAISPTGDLRGLLRIAAHHRSARYI